MSEPIFYDTETCGLNGPVVLIQYAQGDGEISLHSVWKEPVQATIDLIEWMMFNQGGLVGFNLTFDHFQLQKIYNMFSRIRNKNAFPEDMINHIAKNESKARDGLCLKPVKVCDLMLVARRGPYQSMMARKPMKIRRVPAVIADDLAKELERRVVLKEIYFSRRKNKNLPHWEIKPARNRDGTYDPNFRDVVMDFKASTALKVIANDLFGENRFGRDRAIFKEIALNPKFNPAELGYAPFATAIATKEDRWKVRKDFPIREIRGKYAWPGVIRHHIDHWHFDTFARQYAEDDVTDTREVYKAFDSPELGDVDSELACMVGSVRWRGFSIDIEGVKELRKAAVESSRVAPRAPERVREYLLPYMDETERLGFKSTKKMVLEQIAKEWLSDCSACNGEGQVKGEDCLFCKGTGAVDHPARVPAKAVLKARSAKKDVEMYDKLILAGRFHASFVIIGTLSNRMSGSDSFNAQAIRSDKKVRSVFTLLHPNTVLCGGDFEAFEVSLAEANYNDPKLREQLQSYTECYKCHGTNPSCDDCQGTNQTKVKVHALFGTMCFPHMTYEEIVKDKIVYTRSKSGLFSQLYGGNYSTLMIKLGVSEKAAIEAEARFANTYEGVKRARQVIFDKFCSMRQPAGIGTNVEWHEPSDFIENMLDPPFRRYFLLENQVTKILFELSNSPPKHWKDHKEKIQRDQRDFSRVQTISGATQSALYGAAFQLQAANMRAAANHVIQSTGAEICKATQLAIWELQPCGISPWLVMPMNIHDEIECVVKDDSTLVESVKQVVLDKVESYRPLVPLIGMEWKTNMANWGEK